MLREGTKPDQRTVLDPANGAHQREELTPSTGERPGPVNATPRWTTVVSYDPNFPDILGYVILKRCAFIFLPDTWAARASVRLHGTRGARSKKQRA